MNQHLTSGGDDRVWSDVVAPVLELMRSDARLVVGRARWLLVILLVALVIALAAGIVGRGTLASGIAGQVVFLGAILIGLFPMSGIVSDDCNSGTIAFWIQKGGSVRAYYLGSYFIRQVVLLGLSLGLIALLALLASTHSLTWEAFRRYAAFVVVVVLLNSSIVFALSAAGLARDSILAALWMVGTVLLYWQLTKIPGLGFEAVRWFCYPFDGLGELLGTGGRAPGMPPAAAWLTMQYVGWTALGAALVNRTALRAV